MVGVSLAYQLGYSNDTPRIVQGYTKDTATPVFTLGSYEVSWVFSALVVTTVLEGFYRQKPTDFVIEVLTVIALVV